MQENNDYEKQVNIISFSDIKVGETVYLVTFKNGDNPFFTRDKNCPWITDNCIVFTVQVTNIHDVEKKFRLVERKSE